MRTTNGRWIAAIAVVCGLFCGQAQAEEGLYAGVDMLFLAPKISRQGIYNIFNYDNAAVLSSDGTIASDLNFSQRVILGYEGDQGGGVQFRWFTFDNAIAYTGEEEHVTDGTGSLAGDVNMEIDAFDAELTQRGNFSCWNWLATAGVRVGDISLREDAINEIDWEQFVTDFAWAGEAGVRFDGVGPTVSVRGARPLFWDCCSIFGSARTALLFGDLEQFRYYSGRWTNPDETVQVWEIQAGCEMDHEFDRFDFVCRVFWEAQRWDSDSNLLGDVALHGFGVYTGIVY